MRTAIPVEGRFEHIVLSCNATSDHALVWIERESQKLFDVRTKHITPTNLEILSEVFLLFFSTHLLSFANEFDSGIYVKDLGV